MKSFRRELWFELPQRRGLVNITPEIEASVRESGVREGLVLVNAMHITASVFINDDESGLHHDLLTALDAVACPAAGSCVAPAAYVAGSGAVDVAFDTLSGGTWTAAEAPLPAGAATSKQNAYFNWVICPAPGDCVAVGAYTAGNGSSQPLIETGT